jgi:hypothetical protein
MRKHKKKINEGISSAQLKALFLSGMFSHKVEVDRKKFNRKRKHKNKEID